MKKETPSAIIVIRHGQTNYTEVFPDLTEEGVSQVSITSKTVKKYLDPFQDDQILAISSPAERAQGTMHYVLEGLNRDLEYALEPLLKPLEILDFNAFMEFDKKNATEKYGEMWLTHPELAIENLMVESRVSVDKRARDFLLKSTQEVQERSEESGKPQIILATTHFEIQSNFIRGLYPQSEYYPILTAKAPDYAEILVMETTDPSNLIYTLQGRNMAIQTQLNPITGRFKPLVD